MKGRHLQPPELVLSPEHPSIHCQRHALYSAKHRLQHCSFSRGRMVQNWFLTESFHSAGSIWSDTIILDTLKPPRRHQLFPLTRSSPSASSASVSTHVLAIQALNISLYVFLLYFSLPGSPLYISLYISCFLLTD